MRILFGLIMAFGLAGAMPASAKDALSLTPGTETAADGRPVRYEIGAIEVPESRAKPGSRRITVGVLRIKAAKPGGQPPIFLLVGGPGVTMLDTIGDPSPAARRRLGSWLDYSATNDLVIVEQRGYTLRGDMLELRYPAMPLDRPATIEDDVAVMRRLANEAAAANPGRDLSGYTIAECADDVDAVRRALGYPKIGLMGASFGSQWSFAVLKRHPGTVARALIASAEPLNNGYDMPGHVFAVLQRVAFEAEQDPALRPFIPQSGLIAAARTVRDRFAKGPITVDLPEGKVVIGLGDYQQSLFAKVINAAGWPAFVINLYHGRYQAWAREVAEGRKAGTQSLIGPLIDTATGVTAARLAQLESDPALDMLGRWNFAAYTASAGLWPSTDLGDGFRLPVRDETPILFVQGDWDANTPMENLLDLLPWFPNARALIVHRGQHNGPMPLLRDHPDIAAEVLRFLREGGMAELPSRVEAAPIKFALPAASG
ncbi:alpha/beta fold hydrolase [Sphingomonas sp. VL_57B]|jgi:pimeloyl-ACP methyl ester carboxylesterase|uniref:alpha/beta fold hydrolase n=1 Tax=unclassified Sphingomonas TaxID=196159 RepID=UPI0029F0BF38|nr:alpha/beta fold hydrolase [Pseudomonadota bacterium]